MWIRETGSARRYRNTETGESISRRQYDQRFGRIAEQGFRTNEEQARANQANRHLPFNPTPARGRRKIRIIESPDDLYRVARLLKNYRRSHGRRILRVDYIITPETPRPKSDIVIYVSDMSEILSYQFAIQKAFEDFMRRRGFNHVIYLNTWDYTLTFLAKPYGTSRRRTRWHGFTLAETIVEDTYDEYFQLMSLDSAEVEIHAMLTELHVENF